MEAKFNTFNLKHGLSDSLTDIEDSLNLLPSKGFSVYGLTINPLKLCLMGRPGVDFLKGRSRAEILDFNRLFLSEVDG